MNKHKIIRGRSATIECQAFYDDSMTAPVPLAGASIIFIAKKRADDLDSAALFSKSIGTGIAITDSGMGKFNVTLSASDTNSIDLPQLYYETLVKESNGAIHGNGVNLLELEGNVRKILP